MLSALERQHGAAKNILPCDMEIGFLFVQIYAFSMVFTSIYVIFIKSICITDAVVTILAKLYCQNANATREC